MFRLLYGLVWLMYCECVSTPEFLAGNRVSLTHAGEGGVVVSALRVRCSRTRLQSGAKCLGSARRSRVTASPGLVEERERGRRTVVDQRPPLLCEPDDGPARPDAGPPRERSKHPPHGRFPQEAERNHPPRDQEGVTVWARGQPSGSCALVRQSEAASDPSRYALSPLVVEPSSRLSEREEEEPGRDRLEVERRIRCQVGREVHAPVDERVGDQDTEQDRPRQLYERSLVSQRVSEAFDLATNRVVVGGRSRRRCPVRLQVRPGLVSVAVPVPCRSQPFPSSGPPVARAESPQKLLGNPFVASARV